MDGLDEEEDDEDDDDDGGGDCSEGIVSINAVAGRSGDDEEGTAAEFTDPVVDGIMEGTHPNPPYIEPFNAVAG